MRNTGTQPIAPELSAQASAVRSEFWGCTPPLYSWLVTTTSTLTDFAAVTSGSASLYLLNHTSKNSQNVNGEGGTVGKAAMCNTRPGCSTSNPVTAHALGKLQRFPSCLGS